MTKFSNLYAAGAGALVAAGLTAFFMSGEASIEANAAAKFDDAFKEKVQAVLVEHPEIIIEAMDGYQAKQAELEREQLSANVTANLDKLKSTPGIHVAGNPNGKIKMVEFFDYNCGFCKRALPSVMAMLEENPELQVSFIEYPIFGGESARAAAAAIAAGEQGKYLEMHQKLMLSTGKLDDERIMMFAKELKLDTVKLKEDMDSERTAAILDAHDALGIAMGIQGTPAFIVNGEAVGGWDEGYIRNLVKKGAE